MGVLTLSWCFPPGVLMWLTQRVPLVSPSSEIWLGPSCSAPLSIFVCGQPLWLCKYATPVTREVADVPCPASIPLDPQALPSHVYLTRVRERSFLLRSLSEMVPHVRHSPSRQPYPLNYSWVRPLLHLARALPLSRRVVTTAVQGILSTTVLKFGPFHFL